MDRSCREILLVDDNPADVWLVRHAFEETQTDHNLNVAPDGEDALNLLFRRGAHANAPRVDLVLLDLNLPNMNGHSVLRAIRAKPCAGKPHARFERGSLETDRRKPAPR